ncbi:MAG: sulfatase-like hydrolase/transferase, partial [Lysobacterales bacterium]
MRRLTALSLATVALMCTTAVAGQRPNFVFIISDDQSWPHASAYGDEVVKTPAFDRIAEEGVLFTHSFTAT